MADLAEVIERARKAGVDPALIEEAMAMLPPDEDIPELPAEIAVENQSNDLRALMKRAQDVGVDPALLQEAEEMFAPIHQQYRGVLEQQQEQDNQQQREADVMYEGSQDSVLENLYEGAGQLAAGGNALAVNVADLVLSPFRLAARLATGESHSVGDLFGDNDPRKAEFIEEPGVRKAVNTVGELLVSAGSLAPVSRDPSKAASVVADIFGFGMSETPAALAVTGADQATRKAVAARQGRSNIPDITTDDGVLEVADQVARRLEVADNKVNFEAFEDAVGQVPTWEKEVAKAQTKWEKATAKLQKLTEESAAPAAIEKAELKVQDVLEGMYELKAKDPRLVSNKMPKLNKGGSGAYNKKRGAVLDELERLGVNRKYADDLIARTGNVYTTRGFQELIDFDVTDITKLYDGSGGAVSKLGEIFRPASALMRDTVGSVPSYLLERAFERTARAQELFTIKYSRNEQALDSLAQWAEKSSNKARFLDLWHNPDNLAQLVKEAKGSMDPASYELLTELVKDSRKHQLEMSKVFKKDIQKDQYFWASRKKAGDVAEGSDQYVPGAATRSSTADKIKQADFVAGVQSRTRKLASEMSEQELAEYGNPILEQIKRLNQEQGYKHITENFSMRPSLGLGDDSRQFFQQFEDTIGRQSGSIGKAKAARYITENVYLGTTVRPPKAVELFMKQAYAGTLGQFDSALLNMHDIFVSMHRNGVTPTLKAILDSEGMDITKLGIGGDVKSLGEFQQAFDGTVASGKFPGLTRNLEWYQRKSFKWSGFRMMDRAGKGIVMRAALNKARAAAKAGRLQEEFGYMMKPEELSKIKQALKNETGIDFMEKPVRDLVEDLMFARLGEQQLISAAGRPLAYMKHPGFRWAYALSGFAIKQMEMMKVGVYDAIRKGNYGDAGAFLASYFMFASGGYAFINQMRGLPQAVLGNEDKEPTPEKFLRDLLVEQPLSVLTYNRLGNEYSNSKFAEDPVDYAMSSMAPPSGLGGNVVKDVFRALRGKEPKYHTLSSVPYGDEMRALLVDK